MQRIVVAILTASLVILTLAGCLATAPQPKSTLAASAATTAPAPVSIHFVWGGMDTAEYNYLCGYFPQYQASHGIKISPAFYRYNDAQVATRIAATMKMAAPGTRLVLIGHSYGGYNASITSMRLARMGITVDTLILLDPVEQPDSDKAALLSGLGANGLGNARQDATFGAAAHVAVCLYRDAASQDSQPSGEGRSGCIKAASGKFRNVTYAGQHGDCVWSSTLQGWLRTILAGGEILN